MVKHIIGTDEEGRTEHAMQWLTCRTIFREAESLPVSLCPDYLWKRAFAWSNDA